MTRLALLTAAVVLALMSLAQWALAAECRLSLDEAAGTLEGLANERPRMSGLTTEGDAFILYGNAATGTWTMVLVDGDDCARIVAFGTRYRDVLRGVAG